MQYTNENEQNKDFVRIQIEKNLNECKKSIEYLKSIIQAFPANRQIPRYLDQIARLEGIQQGLEKQLDLINKQTTS